MLRNMMMGTSLGLVLLWYPRWLGCWWVAVLSLGPVGTLLGVWVGRSCVFANEFADFLGPSDVIVFAGWCLMVRPRECCVALCVCMGRLLFGLAWPSSWRVDRASGIGPLVLVA